MSYHVGSIYINGGQVGVVIDIHGEWLLVQWYNGNITWEETTFPCGFRLNGYSGTAEAKRKDSGYRQQILANA